MRNEIDNIKRFVIKEEFNKNINVLFQEHPELSNIGTPEDYNNYLMTIFPNSKVNDILFHGGTLNKDDRGKDYYTSKKSYGLYFTGSRARANSYMNADKSKKDYISRSKIYMVKLNILNPLDKKVWGKWKNNADTIDQKGYEQMKMFNSDGIIVKDFISRFTQYNTQYVVLSMEQVHILGSEKDIEGFKNYILNKQK